MAKEINIVETSIRVDKRRSIAKDDDEYSIEFYTKASSFSIYLYTPELLEFIELIKEKINE